MERTNRTIKAKDKELHDKKKENDKINENLVQVNLEYTKFVAKVRNEEKPRQNMAKRSEKKKSCSEKFECNICNICNVRLESIVKVKNHEKIHHMQTKSAQTEDKLLEDKEVPHSIDENNEEFKPFSCFYCDVKIVDRNNLYEHFEKCHGSIRLFCSAPLGLPYSLSQQCNASP
jgi:hypothetical protein